MLNYHSSKAAQSYRLGELLLQGQLISGQQLNDALTEQQNNSQHLGEILVNKQWVSQKQIQRSLRKQWLLRLTLLIVSFISTPLAAFDFIDSRSSSPGSLEDRDDNRNNSRYKADHRTQISQSLDQAINTRSRLLSVFLQANSGNSGINDNDRQFSDQSLSSNANSDGVITQFTAKIKNHVQAPLTTLLRGEYKSGVDSYSQGMAYQAVWSNKGVKLNLKYQF